MIWPAIRTRAGRALAGFLSILAAVGLANLLGRYTGRKTALDKKRADDMQDAYDRERTRNEIDRNTSGPDARDRLRANWRRD
jgi:hypothetical protein